MREVILVGASWCAACKAMKDWFCDMKMEGITFRYADVEALPEENICGLPVILFREDGKTVYKIDRAIGEGELVHNMVTMGW